MRLRRTAAAIVAAAGLALSPGLAACGSDDPVDEIEQDVEEGGENVEQEVEEGGENVEEEVEDEDDG